MINPSIPPAAPVSPIPLPQLPLPETAQIATALRLGWYFTELRGRHDDEVFRQPRPPVVDAEDSLCLGDERSREEQAAEVAAVVGAAASALGADPDIDTFGSFSGSPSDIAASKRLAEICERLRKGGDSDRELAWHDLEKLLCDWDQAIQRSLAVASPRVSAAYQLGRALSDVRWSLHPSEFGADQHGWQFLLGPWRSAMLVRLIDRLSPFFNDRLTPVALKRSVAGWAAVVQAGDLFKSGAVPQVLAAQSEIWHDLLLGERSASDLINHAVDSLVRKPSVLLLAMKPFRLEIALLVLSFLGFIAASWLLFTNTPAAAPGVAMGSAPAGQSVVGVAQNVGGRSAVSAVIAIMSLFGITLAGLSARAKTRLQDLVQGIRDGIDTVLVCEAAMLLPATSWPLLAEGNLYLRFATLRQRALAVMLDWLVLLACDLTVIFATWLVLSFVGFGEHSLRNTVVIVTLIMAWLYFAGWPAGSGRGIGMWTQRMRILDAEGGWVPDTVQIFKRAIAVLVPFELLAIAFWLVPFGAWVAAPIIAAVAWLAFLCWTITQQPNRRAWHDLWAGTVVVAATDPDYDFATLARTRPVTPAAKPAPPAEAGPVIQSKALGEAAAAGPPSASSAVTRPPTEEPVPTGPPAMPDGTPLPRRLQLRQAEGSGPVSAAPSAAGSSNFTDMGGPVLPAVTVHLVLWGAAWAGGGSGPSSDDVAAAFSAVISGPYMSALGQYRGVGSGSLASTTIVSDSEPPNQFSNYAVARVLKQLFEQNRLSEPDSGSQLLYCAVMPPGVVGSDPNVIGEHSFFYYWDVELPFDFDLAQKVYYAWVLNDGTIEGMTTIFSHELVEAATDPEGSAIMGDAGSCYGGGWCEIGDVCQGNVGPSNGVTVQAYWSQRDGACIIPA